MRQRTNILQNRRGMPTSARKPGERGTELKSDSEVSVAIAGRWMVLMDRRAGTANLPFPGDDFGQPGLWKWRREADGLHRVFEVPVWVLRGKDADEDAALLTRDEALQWATATRLGGVPRNWAPPTSDLVQSWVAPGALTLQSRGCVCQAELVLLPTRWALRAPLVATVDPQLPVARRKVLEQWASDAQSHWAMLRLGVPGAASPVPLLAEVDLTGAPHSELLFSAALNVLQHASSLIETANVLSSARVELACLAQRENNCPNQTERTAA
jgi:hypothetical protein